MPEPTPHRKAETVLLPQLEICDPHHHLWDYPKHRYLHPQMLADIAGGHRVTSTVYVECMSCYAEAGPPTLRPVGETHFVVSQRQLARKAAPDVDLAAGIVGFADLCCSDLLEAVLDAHIAAGDGRFRGIRHVTAQVDDPAVAESHTRPPPGLMTDPDYIRGCRVLARRGLVLDAWLYHCQLGELAALACAVPDLTIVLDHLGGPLGVGTFQGRRKEVFARWKSDLAEVAACDNVVIKLGGMAMPVNGFGWHKYAPPADSATMAAAYAPWYHHAMELFGAHRCMFESNFPVDNISCSYSVLWNMFKRLAAGCSEDSLHLLFRDTARRVYQMDAP